MDTRTDASDFGTGRSYVTARLVLPEKLRRVAQLLPVQY